MPFGKLAPSPPDPVLALTGRFVADPRPYKLDLGVGVYRDAAGGTPVFKAVKDAERRLWESQSTKSYLGIDGDTAFVERLADEALEWHNAAGLQTVGGTGALRLAADGLATTRPGRRIWIGAPTWPNHLPICAAAGLRAMPVDLFDPASQTYQHAKLLDAMRRPNGAKAGDAVLLHGCCHNPTGIDPEADFWIEMADLIVDRGVVPLVDLAYQGLGRGWKSDGAASVRLLRRLGRLLIAYSCDKNVGLYRERVGALFIAGETGEETDALRAHLTALARSSYSMPPDHGAAVVRTILEDAELSALWRTELDGMRIRMLKLRAALAARGRVGGVDLALLSRGQGMFAMLPLTAPQIALLQSDFGIYMAPSGRINIAGLSDATAATDDVGYFVDALSRLPRAHPPQVAHQSVSH